MDEANARFSCRVCILLTTPSPDSAYSFDTGVAIPTVIVDTESRHPISRAIVPVPQAESRSVSCLNRVSDNACQEKEGHS
jgi:hypothetical protein